MSSADETANYSSVKFSSIYYFFLKTLTPGLYSTYLVFWVFNCKIPLQCVCVCVCVCARTDSVCVCVFFWVFEQQMLAFLSSLRSEIVHTSSQSHGSEQRNKRDADTPTCSRHRKEITLINSNTGGSMQIHFYRCPNRALAKKRSGIFTEVV